ncbi:manganese-dependent ADP-ribose/CDP-alcohol diphosphatase-like [Panonychus citri]|uniref:manganese-dependent ADP-ribose/CDP-alcohol diphosphatase-like n=1 Tax=Panonychus citri TaxID=50023 RepID=UPI0023073F30|nr:manganese-dependent ADP-ribose/CDP-alcohol diphosphatase-like [Panonychus citri]
MFNYYNNLLLLISLAQVERINLNCCMLTSTGPVVINQLINSHHVHRISCLPLILVKSSLLRWSEDYINHLNHHKVKLQFIPTGGQCSNLSSCGQFNPLNWVKGVNLKVNPTTINCCCEYKTKGLVDRFDCDPFFDNNIPSSRQLTTSTMSEIDSTTINHDSSSPGNQLIAKFGVLTDVQYADTDDKPAHYDPTKTRYYRASLNHVVHAFNHWDRETIKPTFVLQFGDIIDGLNKRTNGLDPLEAINKTLATFEAHPTIPTFHAVGNHELYNFDRAEIISLFRDSLIKKTKVKPDLMGLNLNVNENPVNCSSSSSSSSSSANYTLYYKFTPSPKLKIIALDCFEISVIGYDPNHPNYRQAEEILYKYHGHRDFDLWDIDDHLPEGPEKRFQQMNGALSEQQLTWLSRELQDSELKGEKVIVFGHVCLHPGSCDWSCLVWNYDRVIETFHKYNCVISYMSGHAHKFGHSVDEKGIHYIVYHGVIETSPTNEAFATISLYHDRLQVDGYGLEKSLTLPLPSSAVSSVPPAVVTPLGSSNGYDVSNYADPVSNESPTTIRVTV